MAPCEGLSDRSGFFAVVDGHGAAHKVDNLHVDEFEFVHFFGDGKLRGVVFERFEDVGVGFGVAAEEEADQRHGHLQVGEIKRAPEGVRGFAEIKDDKAGAGLGHTMHFLEAALPTREISQAIADGDDIERTVWKWYVLGVPLDESWSGLAGLLIAFGGDGEHFGTEIKARGRGAVVGEGKTNIARTAAEVQSAGLGCDFCKIHDAALPTAV